MNFKYKIIILILSITFITPSHIIQASLFTDYFTGILVVYWGYLLLFSNRYFVSNSMFVQRFPSLKSLYGWYIKKEFQLAAIYILLLDVITITVNIVVSYQLQWIPVTLTKTSIKYIIMFTIVNIMGIVILRLFMLWIQLVYPSYAATISYCLYVGLSALFSFISVPAVEIDFSIISPAFKGEFFNQKYLLLSYIIMIIIGTMLYQNVKRVDRKL